MDPGVPAPGTLRFPRSWLASLASAGPALPATCSAWEGRVLYWAACTRSASSTTFSDHRRLLLISAHPQKNVSPRRSCGACLRRPYGAGARPLKYPEVPWGRLRRAPPGPAVRSMSLASPVDSLYGLVDQTCLGDGNWGDRGCGCDRKLGKAAAAWPSPTQKPNAETPSGSVYTAGKAH
jgi:hypothetical protein